MPRRSVNQRMKLPRSKGGVDPRVRAQMDRFVEGLLMGLGSTQAAVFAGVSSASAAGTGQKYRVDPYVRARFLELREKLSKDEVCSYVELALNVKSIAFDESKETITKLTSKGECYEEQVDATTKGERIRASKLLAQMQGYMAETKVSTTVNGGVLLLPVAESMEQWESQAIAAQAALQKEVEQDANR
jgi:phage terminase small subunit